MRIVALGDTHSDIDSIMTYLDKVKELSPDVIVFSGDFVDMGVGFKGFDSSDIVKLILEELKYLGKPVLAVPGNQDKEILSVLEEEDVSLHGVGRVVDGVGFYGFGGAKTPFGTPFEPEEDDIERGLKKAHEDVKDSDIVVQVTHNPPHNTQLDVIGSGAHVGSKVVRKVIEDLEPEAAICAHIHEARGTDSVGKTKVLNPGRFPEGYCGVIDIDVSSSEVTTKVISLI